MGRVPCLGRFFLGLGRSIMPPSGLHGLSFHTSRSPLMDTSHLYSDEDDVGPAPWTIHLADFWKRIHSVRKHLNIGCHRPSLAIWEMQIRCGGASKQAGR